MSKGSSRRPNFVPLADLAARWDATFGTPPVVQSDDHRVLASPSPVVALQYNGTFPPGRLTSAYAEHADGSRTPLPSTPDGEA